MSFNFDRRTFLKGAGAVGAASLLAACGEKSNNTGNGAAASGAAAPNSTGATPLKEFISFESGNRELESWNMLYTQKAEDANVVTNLWDGLLSFDRYGKVVPAIASSWEHNEDATVWTFHLRDENWLDCNGEVLGPVTAQDFVDALAYVLKPVSYYAFSQRLSRAIERAARRARHYLQINARGTAHKIDTAALYWVESCGHDLVFHTAEGALTASGSMAETETRLAQDSFFRVNKGCLVNLEHVDCMDGEDAVVHGERVPIARARRKAFLDALNDYINGAG